jgi:DNA primase
MPRIPNDVLERLKLEVSVVTLIERAGVPLKKVGENLVGLCPLHDDHEPSLVVSSDKNIWHCMGACQAGGSVIDWTMRKDGVSFRHAVDVLLSEFFPQEASTLVDSSKRTTVPQLACPVDLDVDGAELASQVIDYYHETLKASPNALAYLEQRGLQSSEMIDRFRLGYANRTLGYRLPAMNRAAGEKIRTRLQKLGFLRESGHELLSGSLVIPILGESGEILGAYGRKVLNHLRTGTAYHLYLPGPHRGVFNVEAFKASTEIILCEALIDALTFWCAGFRNVTSSYGVEGFTHDHLAAMKAYGTEKVLIAYDRDEAGDRASEKLSHKLIAEGLECFRVQFPRGMDANLYARKVKPASAALGLLLRNAEWLGKGKRSSLEIGAPIAGSGSVLSPSGGAGDSSAPATKEAAPLLAADVGAHAHELPKERATEKKNTSAREPSAEPLEGASEAEEAGTGVDASDVDRFAQSDTGPRATALRAARGAA